MQSQKYYHIDMSSVVCDQLDRRLQMAIIVRKMYVFLIYNNIEG